MATTLPVAVTTTCGIGPHGKPFVGRSPIHQTLDWRCKERGLVRGRDAAQRNHVVSRNGGSMTTRHKGWPPLLLPARHRSCRCWHIVFVQVSVSSFVADVVPHGSDHDDFVECGGVS